MVFDLNNAVVWMVVLRPLIFNSSSIFCSLWGMFQVHQLLSVSPLPICFTTSSVLWQSLSTYLYFRFLWFSFCDPLGQQNPLDGKFSFFEEVIITRSRLLTGIRWSVCIAKSQRDLCVSFFKRNSSLCIYHLVVESNFNFLPNSKWINFSTETCPVLYFFSTNLLHSLITWSVISSLSLYYLHLLFCCV